MIHHPRSVRHAATAAALALSAAGAAAQAPGDAAWRTATVDQGALRAFDASWLPPADITFAVIADTHVEPVGPPFPGEGMDAPDLAFRKGTDVATNNARLVRAVEQINALGVDFTVHLGDIVRTMPFGVSFERESELALQILDGLEAPVHLAPGNHDIGNKPSMEMMEIPPMRRTVCAENTELYRSIFGDPFSSWDHDGAHFVVLNTMAFNSGIACDAEQWAWLREDLAEHGDAEHLYLFGHVALYWASPEDIGFRNYEVVDEPARSELLELVERYDVDAVYTGHTHHMYRNLRGDTELISAPSTAFTRNTWGLYPDQPPRTMNADKLGFLLVRVTEGRTVTSLVRLVDDAPAARAAQASLWPAPLRVLTRQSVESRGGRLLVEAEAPRHVEAGWQAHDLVDGHLDRTAGMVDGEHAWRTYVGVGAFPFPVELRVDLEGVHPLREVRLSRTRLLADWALEVSVDGETWDAVASGPAEGAEDGLPVLPDRTVSLDGRPVSALRLRFEGEMPPPGTFRELVVGELQAWDTDGVNRAAAREGGHAHGTAFGATPREAIRDQAWLAAYDLANRRVRVATPDAAWAAVEHRPGAMRLPPMLDRALDAGVHQGLELTLPLTVVHPEHPVDDLGAFRAYVAFLVRAAGDRVAVWELPYLSDGDPWGRPGEAAVSAAGFLDRLAVVEEVVAAGRPDARVAVSGVPLEDDVVVPSLLEALADRVDRIALDLPVDTRHLDDDTLLKLLEERLVPLRDQHPDARFVVELRSREFGGAPALGATRLAKAFLRLRDRGFLVGVALGGEGGLLDAQDDPFPAFNTLRLLATLFDDGAERVEDPPAYFLGDDLEQRSYRRPDGSWFVVGWSVHRGGLRRARLVTPAGAEVTAYDTLSCTSQALRTGVEEGRGVADGVMLFEHPVVFHVR